MGDRRRAYSVFVGRPDGKRKLESLGIDGSVILKCIFKKMGWGGMEWNALDYLRTC